MPERVVRACQSMGSKRNGHLRELVGKPVLGGYGLKVDDIRSCYVLEVDDKIVGWVCLYMFAGVHCSSVWVSCRYRGKGYGKLLMDKAWSRWYNLNPRTYKGFADYWFDRESNIKRRSPQLSPNACVTNAYDEDDFSVFENESFDIGWND